MGQRFHSRQKDRAAIVLGTVDDAAAVYPDHDIVTRHFQGPLTVGDFVAAFSEGAEWHGGLPTYLRITLRGDATKLRRLVGEKWPKVRISQRVSH